MIDTSRPNIYKILEGEFKVFDTLIDVGCAGLFDLVDFEYSPFKKLIGIDKYPAANAFVDYRKRKLTGREVSDEEFRILNSDLYNIFKERFIIHYSDFLEIEFGIETNSFIICNKVLHFYEDQQKFEIIRKFYDSLQYEGMIYLKINHNLNPNNTDLDHVIKVKQNVYQSKEIPEDIRYLIDSADFIKDLQIRYNILQPYTTISDGALTVILRK